MPLVMPQKSQSSLAGLEQVSKKKKAICGEYVQMLSSTLPIGTETPTSRDVILNWTETL